jgi:hypothetical protein
MQTIFDLCTPREEVLKGDLREDLFAARLKDVMDGSAEPVYGDAKTFFDNTYPTAGLKTLLNDVLGRLSGVGSGKNAVVRLETAFGGGKTHNLIALYHAASGSMPQQYIDQLLETAVQYPKAGSVRVAGVVGSDLDPTVGIMHPESGIKTLTLWGELAYQLAGAAGYELVRESEKVKAAVGTGLFETLIGNQPALIMLDEISRHLRSARAVQTATKQSNLAEQTVAFLMSLLEFAASKSRCVVVITLASESDAFGSETSFLRQSLSEALQISARQERVLTPTVESEIPAIVTHRLFKHIDRKAAVPVFEAYAQYYNRLFEQNVDLPTRATRADYIQGFKDSYPFHPELLATLNRKVATIPNFNQTRGALRLLAWTIRSLWGQKKPGIWTIHLHDIDLGNPQIADDLTGRLDRPRFKQVIEADIVSITTGMPAHAQGIDAPLIASGKPPYARQAASTIFLHSLTQGTASGVDPSDMLLAFIKPDGQGGGDDPGIIQHTIERLYKSAWFLEYDGHHYRFKTEPSLNKIIEDEAAHVGPSKAKTELETRIRQIWKKGYLQPIFFPVEPADVDDDAGAPKLVVIHFDAAHGTAADVAPPDLVRRMYEYTGSLQSFRKFQNNVLFLVSDSDQVENMVQVARRYLAIGRIVGDAARMAEFNKEQKDELKKMKDTAELDVRVAITKAYRYLYYPSSDGLKTNAYLRRESLPAQDQGEVDKDQSNVVLRVLRALSKVLTADDESLSAMFVRSKAWDQNQVVMSTEDLRKAFARKNSLKILLDVGQLRKTIQNGVRTGTWIYYDSSEEFGYDQDSPPPAWLISDGTLLYLPDEASRLNIHIKGKWKEPPGGGGGGGGGPGEDLCPLCGFPVDHCICGGGNEQKPTRLTGQGVVSQAFQQILDKCQEYEFTHLNRMILTITAMGKQAAADLRAVGLSIPQFGKGTYTIDHDMTASYGSQSESFQLKFKGGWDRYKRYKSITDTFATEASELRLTLKVAVEYVDGLDISGQEFLTMRDVLSTLEVGIITLDAFPRQDDPDSEGSRV